MIHAKGTVDVWYSFKALEIDGCMFGIESLECTRPMFLFLFFVLVCLFDFRRDIPSFMSACVPLYMVAYKVGCEQYCRGCHCYRL